MNKNQELKIALILLERLNQLEKLLLDYYGDQIIELQLVEQNDNQESDKDVDWPF